MRKKSNLIYWSTIVLLHSGEPIDLNSGTCCKENHENNDTTLRKNSNEKKTKDLAKSCQPAKKVEPVESDVVESDNSGKAQNGEMSTAIIKSKSELDSSGSSSRSSALTKRLKGINMKQFCKNHVRS